MEDEAEYWRKVAEVKSKRPPCNYPEGHTFTIYQGKGVQKCVDCTYVEPLVAKDDCNV